MSNADRFVDLSSNNALPNLRKHYKAGHRVIALKVSEGMTYTWDAHAKLADEWHALGGSVWHYHFARPGNGPAQAARFVNLVGPHYKPGDRIVLDAEVSGVDAAFVRDFIGTCHSRTTWPGVVYSYASFLTLGRIRPSHGWGLWLASYGPVQPHPAPGWSKLSAWQFTDKATVEGISGGVDCSNLLESVPGVDPVPAPTHKHHGRRRLIVALRALLHRLVHHN